MNKVAAFALRRKNSVLSMSEKMFCPPQPLRFWITPAYAGKSSRNETCWHRPWDHPCVCGEKGFIGLEVGLYPGSPPRMRGKGGCVERLVGGFRITPACAGKSLTESETAAYCRDHPRVCGEKVWLRRYHLKQKGSPPRMRGKEEN